MKQPLRTVGPRQETAGPESVSMRTFRCRTVAQSRVGRGAPAERLEALLAAFGGSVWRWDRMPT